MTRYRMIVCYDISDNKTRRRFIETLDKYGSRIQKSVYEFYLTRTMTQSLRKEITDFHFKAMSAKKHKEGKSLDIFLIPICRECFQSKSAYGKDFTEHSVNVVL